MSCQVEDAEDQPIGKLVASSSSNCVKCKFERPIVRIRHSDYCRPCFLSSVQTKFRVALAKMKCVTEDADRLAHPHQIDSPGFSCLLATSGGASSRAMLDLLAEFVLSVEKNRRKFHRVVIAWVDESILFPATNLGTAHSHLTELCRQLNLEMVSCRLESSYSSSAEQFQTFLSSLSMDSREDVVRSLRQRCLIDLAKRANCRYVLVADNATRIAINTLSFSSKGRGFSLPFDIANYCKVSSDPPVFLLRPMKDCLTKEVTMYCHYRNISFIPQLSLTTALPPKSSIERLTEEFIFGLDQEYPSTVSTVLRTVNKLQFKGVLDSNVVRCQLCDAAIEPDSMYWKQRVTVSHTVLDAETERKRSYQLCYSCSYVGEEAETTVLRPLLREDLHKRIKECLLSDNEDEIHR